LSLSWGDKK